jgi:hypothetical protein
MVYSTSIWKSLQARRTSWPYARLATDDDSSGDAASEKGESEGKPTWAGGLHPRIRIGTGTLATLILATMGSLSAIGALYTYFPFFTTIPLFVGGLSFVAIWTVTTILASIPGTLGMGRMRTEEGRQSGVWPRWKRICVTIGTMLVLLVCINLGTPTRTLPDLIPTDEGIPERYFIAANLYNNQDILPTWTEEVLALVSHRECHISRFLLLTRLSVGHNNTFISIYESNSQDDTKSLLAQFERVLNERGIPNRIVLGETETRWWPYGNSPERIDFLAAARNRAMEPLQSADPLIRLSDYSTYTKALFLNDIYFDYPSIVRLLATRLDRDTTLPPDYDMACAMDYGASGLYDTWVARDVCGTPMRAFWPYVKDEVSIARLEREMPFEVATCWNGAVAFRLAPYLYRPEREQASTMGKRGWKMIDDSKSIQACVERLLIVSRVPRLGRFS